jgi:hypothetical protein
LLRTGTLFASTMLIGMFSTDLRAAVTYPPPTQWKAINYGPRQNQFFRMLYNWYNTDPANPGQAVYQTVDQDLTRLANNGFNVLHVYLWDREIFTDPQYGVNPNELSGFPSPPANPNTAANNQWAALDDFVGRAESKGLFVALHFASGWLLDRLRAGADPESTSTTYQTWVSSFVTALTPKHRNILLWGLGFSVEPAPGDVTGNWSLTWQKCYKKVDDVARVNSPSPGVVGLVGTNLTMDVLDQSGHSTLDVIGINSGYNWEWQTAQRVASTMRSLLTSAYGYQKDPDIYMMQFYNANSWDLRSALGSLSGTPVSGGISVPASKIFAVEFGTSSSLNNAYGYNKPGFGDKQTPTTTPAGQAQWLNNTLCTLQGGGVQKYAYWVMYDPYVLWSTPPWSYTDLSWVGFWGLANDYVSYGDKSSWTTLSNFYRYGSLACPSQPTAATSIVSLTPANNFYTFGQPVRVTWTAADVASLSLNRTFNSAYSCGKGTLLSTNQLVGSCAFTNATTFTTAGTQSLTLTGANGQGGTQLATASFSVGPAPLVNAVTNQNYQSTIHTTDYLIVWGNGFSVTGGNTLQFTRAGYTDVWMYETDGHYFWDLSYGQINAELAARLAPGQWTLYVRNPYDGTPSTPFTVTIVQ